MKLHIFYFLIFIFGTPSFCLATARPMADDEIRKNIIDGTLKAFADGQCMAISEERIESPTQTSTERSSQAGNESANATQSGSQINNSAITWGGQPNWSAQSQFNNQMTEQNKAQVTEGQRSSQSTTENPSQCKCPCPYSKDIHGSPCGQSSAYYLYPEEYQPKCYPEDIKDYEVQEYREQYDIPRKQ